jgi:hydroxypyruvate reductase
MLAAPAPGLTLEDKRGTSGLLLRAGAAIDGLNAVRKHLSRIKGGRLAAAAAPAALLTLAVSDVTGDRQEVIGSGPTAADPSTFADAWAAIVRCRLQDKIPARVKAFLERGIAGLEEETVKPGDPCLARAAYLVVGSNADAIAGAHEKALALGWQVQVRPGQLLGEARQAARLLAGEARRALGAMAPGERRCLLAGGETTVAVAGSGRGGRNQELALAFALEIAGGRGMEMLSAGTDGLDGPTAAAGAVVDGATVATAARLGLDAAAFLADNDSYSFFSELDRRSGGRHHLRTGPTGVNVMDLQVILLSRPAGRDLPAPAAAAI